MTAISLLTPLKQQLTAQENLIEGLRAFSTRFIPLPPDIATSEDRKSNFIIRAKRFNVLVRNW